MYEEKIDCGRGSVVGVNDEQKINVVFRCIIGKGHSNDEAN